MENPLNYTALSPLKFHVKAEAEYIVFVPPNLDSDYWELKGTTSLTRGFYVVYPAAAGTISGSTRIS